MRIPKQLTDQITREFQARLNEAAKEGIVIQSYFFGAGYTYHFAVEVKKEGERCFNCHVMADKKKGIKE